VRKRVEAVPRGIAIGVKSSWKLRLEKDATHATDQDLTKGLGGGKGTEPQTRPRREGEKRKRLKHLNTRVSLCAAGICLYWRRGQKIVG